MFKDYLHLIRFDKPIGTLLLLWPTWWGVWLAYKGFPPALMVVVFGLGVFLTRAAGCAINDYADSEFDGFVKRTQNRPLVTGAISKKAALLTTAALSFAAFLLAIVFLSYQTLLWSIPALLIYVSYPFFKRFFAIPQLYLGLAFSFGILMAFIQATGEIPLVGWLLFFANITWVLGYDTIYALVDIEDDRKIGIKTAALTFGKAVIPVIMLCYSVFVVLLIFIAYQLNLGWVFYIFLLVAAILIVYVYSQIRHQERMRCFQAFLFNNHIGWVIWLGLVLSFWLK